MNEVLISLGSNEDPEANISLCRSLLSDVFDFIVFSETSVTTPYGQHYKNNFLNQLALATTTLERCEIEKKLKTLEIKMGRLPTDKEMGVVKIDVDLIRWNDIIIKKDEWDRDYIAPLLSGLEKVIADSARENR